MTNKIRFNGTRYDSLDAMPPSVRAAYDQALAFAQQARSGQIPGGKVNVRFATKVRFVHDGQV